MFRLITGAVTTLLIVSVGFLLFAAFAAGQRASSTSVLVAGGGLVLASIATLSGVYFGWRKDRREAAKFKIEMEELRRKSATEEDAK